MPSGQSFRRHACTRRRPGTRSTFTPVTCPASVANLPPTLSLMTALRPVTSVCLRESASKSYMVFVGALKRTLCLMVLHIPRGLSQSVYPKLVQNLATHHCRQPSFVC